MADETALSKAEKEAIRDLVREKKRTQKAASELADMIEKISLMTPQEQDIANRLHTLIIATAPQLQPTTWYGMPAWKFDGKTVCFFQAASKFGARYNTFGFDERAQLDDGEMWATSFALIELTETAEDTIASLVRKATRSLS